MGDYLIKQGDGEPEKVQAKDHYDAARSFAKRHGSCAICVRAEDGGDWIKYECQEICGSWAVINMGVEKHENN